MTSKYDFLAVINALGEAQCNLTNSFETEMERQLGYYLLKDLEDMETRLTLAYNEIVVKETEEKITQQFDDTDFSDSVDILDYSVEIPEKKSKKKGKKHAK